MVLPLPIPVEGTKGLNVTSDSGAVADSQTVPRRIDAARRTEVPRSHRLIRTVGIFLTTIAVLVSIGSFWIMTGASSIEPTPEIWTIIWIVNAVLVLFVVALIVTEALLLFRAWRRKLVGARLRSRLVILFALVAAVPGLIVAAFAAFTLNQGLDQWFSDRTRQIVESSRLIARAYLQEHGQVLRDNVIWVATELEAAHDTFVSDRTRFQHILTALATTRSLPYTSLVAGDGDLLMRAEINVQGRRPTAPASLLPDVQEGVPTLLSPGSTNLVGAMIKLRGYDNVYLFAARTVDPEVLEYVKLTEENITDYRTYESNRLVFQLTFGLMYTGLAVILVLAAVWLGMAMANRFVDPIRNLMVASNRVSRGQLDTRVPAEESVGDLHDLSIRFNQMVGQLESQRQALIDANENAEKRRQFTEAVVEGVSAGVVGLDSDGTITLANKRAGEMFHREEVDLMDRPVTEAAPQLEPLMARARSSRTGQLRDQIELSHNGEVRTYQVQLTREGNADGIQGLRHHSGRHHQSRHSPADQRLGRRCPPHCP